MSNQSPLHTPTVPMPYGPRGFLDPSSCFSVYIVVPTENVWQCFLGSERCYNSRMPYRVVSHSPFVSQPRVVEPWAGGAAPLALLCGIPWVDPSPFTSPSPCGWALSSFFLQLTLEQREGKGHQSQCSQISTCNALLPHHPANSLPDRKPY